MARVAWFTPLPPIRSGIAAYSSDVLPGLAARHAIDVFTAADAIPDGVPPGCSGVFPARDFVWKHFTAPYDLVIYQLGNATCHDFMWPYLFRYPGLVVLHDAQLHHSRARALLTQGRADDYRAEFRANHPGTTEGASWLVAHDLADACYYFWPMVRLVVESARLTAVHAPRLADTLSARYGREVATIRMGVADPWAPGGVPADGGRMAARRAALGVRFGIPVDVPVFAAFGLVTPEKRISQALRAMRGVLAISPSAHLLLVGGTADYYDARAEAADLGVADHVTITGYVPDEELPDYLGAADVCLCLRWPTGRETSASWMRALAAGRPTITIDLAHTDDVASLDPRTWAVRPAGSGAAAASAVQEPVCVAIDILDEQHSLGLAMERLAARPALRDQLGRAARAHWAAGHTVSCMVEDYDRAIARAMALPPRPPVALPRHLAEDGTEQVKQMAEALGVDIDFVTGSRD